MEYYEQPLCNKFQLRWNHIVKKSQITRFTEEEIEPE